MLTARRIVLLAAALAVAGFALVAFGDRGPDEVPESYGWFAFAPGDADWTMGDPQDAYSSSLEIQYAVSTTTVVGIGLLAFAALLTAGLVGYQLAIRRRSST